MDTLGNEAGSDAGSAVDEVDFAVVEHQRALIATVRGASSQASCKTASKAAACNAIKPPAWHQSPQKLLEEEANKCNVLLKSS